MTVLILNRAAKYVPYAEWLAELNEDLLLLTSNNVVQKYNDKGFKEIIGFDDYPVNGCVEYTALSLFEQYRYRTIVSYAERDLLRAGRLRDMLSLEGQSWRSAEAFRDKTVMKALAEAGGVSIPVYKAVSDALDIINFVKKNRYPVIIKPIDGIASTDITILNHEDDLIRFLSKGIPRHLEIEKFIEGDMFHIDGLIVKGELKFICPSKYLGHCLDFQSELGGASYMLSRCNPLYDSLVSFTARVLTALPTPQNTAFHAEAFVTSSGEIVLCEIASRIGGAKIVESIRHSCNIDLRKAMIQTQCGIYKEYQNLNMKDTVPEALSGAVLIRPNPGILQGIFVDKMPSWVVEYELNAEIGKNYGEARNSSDCIASVLVSGETETIVVERMRMVVQMFKQGLKWEMN